MIRGACLCQRLCTLSLYHAKYFSLISTFCLSFTRTHRLFLGKDLIKQTGLFFSLTLLFFFILLFLILFVAFTSISTFFFFMFFLNLYWLLFLCFTLYHCNFFFSFLIFLSFFLDNFFLLFHNYFCLFCINFSHSSSNEI